MNKNSNIASDYNPWAPKIGDIVKTSRGRVGVILREQGWYILTFKNGGTYWNEVPFNSKEAATEWKLYSFEFNTNDPIFLPCIIQLGDSSYPIWKDKVTTIKEVVVTLKDLNDPSLQTDLIIPVGKCKKLLTVIKSHNISYFLNPVPPLKKKKFYNKDFNNNNCL